MQVFCASVSGSAQLRCSLFVLPAMWPSRSILAALSTLLLKLRQH